MEHTSSHIKVSIERLAATKPCPSCLGKPHAGRCGLCFDQGFLLADRLCHCGRPLLIVEEDGTPWCGYDRKCLTDTADTPVPWEEIEERKSFNRGFLPAIYGGDDSYN